MSPRPSPVPVAELKSAPDSQKVKNSSSKPMSSQEGIEKAGSEQISAEGKTDFEELEGVEVDGKNNEAGVNSEYNDTNGESDSDSHIIDVWQDNLFEEFIKIREVVKAYTYVAMDTEFPGTVVRLIGEFRNPYDYNFDLVKSNVDSLNLIQLGLTFMDAKGNLPPCGGTWQFNFKFNLDQEMHAQDSIELLKRAGIDFDRCKTQGIEYNSFAELLITSGVLMMEEITWITFHCQYDVSYLLRLLRNEKMASTPAEFFILMKAFFPVLYDLKYVMKSCKNLSGSLGLQDVADLLEVKRIGPKHQAGSDSLLTGKLFFKLKDLYFEGSLDEEKYNGRVYGFSGSYYLYNE